MTLFFVISPYAVTHQVLPLLKERKFQKLTIVTTEGLAPFFKGLNIKTITSSVNINLFDRKSKRKFLSNIIKANKEYKLLFEGLNNEEIYLFFSSWAVVYFSYIAKLSKNNRIYLYETPQSKEIIYKKAKGVRAFLMKHIAKLFLKVDTEIYHMGMTLAYVLKRESYPIKTVTYDKFNSSISDIFIDEPKLKGKDILFLGEEVENEGANLEDVIKTTNFLYNLFKKYHKDSYVIKGHPYNGIIYGKMSNSKSIISNKSIAEPLLGHKWKFIISYYSEFLLTAKKNSKAKVISLLYLWKWRDLKEKKYWVDVFGNADILMPKSLSELEEILMNDC